MTNISDAADRLDSWITGGTEDADETVDADLRTVIGAARAFDKTKRPWLEAQEGEVWVLELSGGSFPMIFQAGMFRDHGGSSPADWFGIRSGHRVWPPDEGGMTAMGAR